MSNNTRGQYWLEATDHIRNANDYTFEDRAFWASTISALINAVMASAPDAVMVEVENIMAERKIKQMQAQADIERLLKL